VPSVNRIRAVAARVAAAIGMMAIVSLRAAAPVAFAQEMDTASGIAPQGSAAAPDNAGVFPNPSASTGLPSASASPVPTQLGSAVPPPVMQWAPIILKYSRQYAVDPNLVAAIMMSESGGDPNATSRVGAAGLMQVMGGSYDPDTNVQQGVAFLATLLQRYGSDLDMVVAAYNAGGDAVSTYRGIPPYQETQMYVFSVLNRYYLYISG
jgi:soluble lytic murein transglycosylase-like protein